MLSQPILTEIRNDLSRSVHYFGVNESDFIESLGLQGLSDAAVKAVWSVYVAHHLKN